MNIKAFSLIVLVTSFSTYAMENESFESIFEKYSTPRPAEEILAERLTEAEEMMALIELNAAYLPQNFSSEAAQIVFSQENVRQRLLKFCEDVVDQENSELPIPHNLASFARRVGIVQARAILKILESHSISYVSSDAHHPIHKRLEMFVKANLLVREQNEKAGELLEEKSRQQRLDRAASNKHEKQTARIKFKKPGQMKEKKVKSKKR